MYLRYYLDENGNRVYTFKYVNSEGQPTQSAHPARFSPDSPRVPFLGEVYAKSL